MKSGYCSSQRISFAPVTGCNQKAWCEESTYGPFETLLHNAFRNDSALQPGWTYWYKSTNICCLSLNRGSLFMFLQCELALVRTGRLENSGFWLMTVAASVCPSHTCDRGERFNTCATYHKTATPLASNVLVSSTAKGEGFLVLDQYTVLYTLRCNGTQTWRFGTYLCFDIRVRYGFSTAGGKTKHKLAFFFY